MSVFCWLCRAEKEWKELQIEVGELLEARPEEGADNSPRREHYCGAAC